MAKPKRLKNADEAFMGPKPSYGPHNPIPESNEDREREYRRATHWFYYFENKKKATETVLTYCKRVLKFDKNQIANLKKVPDYKYRMGTYQHIEMINNGWVGHPLNEELLERVHNKIFEAEALGKVTVKEEDNKPKPVVIPPAVRMRQKVMETIWHDFDTMVVDKWMEGEFDKKKVVFPTYSLLQLHKIKGAGINMFKEKIQFEYDLVSDAYHKKCEQAVEAYSHIKKGDLRKMLDLLTSILDDIDRLKANTKVTRIPRAKKPKASDKQVEKLNYKVQDDEVKLVSINPIMIPGKNKLFVYNTKQRVITVYSNDSAAGFEVKGSTVYNWDEKTSMSTTLRKPDDILPQILTKTEKQIEKVLSSLTTKVKKPTGRINKDCILLRVL